MNNWSEAVTCCCCDQRCWEDHLVVLQMYARKLGECLLRLGDAGEDHEAAAADLHRWIVELTSLGACIMYGNPHLLKAIQSGSLDHSHAPVQDLSDMFYADVLVRMSALVSSSSCQYVLLPPPLLCR